MENNKWLDTSRLTVVVGHFGSGKSEFAINMALALADRGYAFALADLDVVDPYFRSRSCRSVIEKRGGLVIASSQACQDADVPSMPPNVAKLFDNQELHGVLDIGGDASGARVLARYRKRLAETNAQVLCVINANRPMTNTAEKAAQYVKSIEKISGLRITGLVNNTHLFEQTKPEDIMYGAAVAEQLYRNIGIKLVCNAVSQDMVSRMSSLQNIFPMSLYLKKPWEKTTPEEVN